MLSQEGNTVILKSADNLVGSVKNGEQIRELIGNVELLQGNVTLKCDRAIQYFLSNRIEVFGNVSVQQDTLFLFCQNASYYGNSRTTVSPSKLRLTDGHLTLNSNSGRYNADLRQAEFYGDVRVVDINNTIFSDTLIYLRDSSKLFCYSRVKVLSQENNIMGYSDTLEYYRKSQLSILTGEPLVLFIDTTKNISSIDSLSNDILIVDTNYLQNTNPRPLEISALADSNRRGIEPSFAGVDTNYLQNTNPRPLGNSTLADSNRRGIEPSFAGIDTNYLQNTNPRPLGNSTLADSNRHGIEPSFAGVDTNYLQNTNPRSLVSSALADSNRRGIEPSFAGVDTNYLQNTNPRSLGNSTLADSNRRGIEPSFAGVDTLFIRGKTIISDNTAKLLFAKDSVKVFRNDFSLSSNNLTYLVDDSTIVLEGSPVMWYENNQLTSDSMTIRLFEKSVKDITASRNGFLLSPADSSSEHAFNQMMGDTIFIFFTKNRIDSSISEGKAIALYYVMDSSGISGAYKSTAERIKIESEENRVKRVKTFYGIDDIYYPHGMIVGNENQYNLSRFKIITDRPLREEFVVRPPF